MAQQMFDVCGRCRRPAKMLYQVGIKAVRTDRADREATENVPRPYDTIGYADLMCMPCWKRCAKFIERGVKPIAKAEETT